MIAQLFGAARMAQLAQRSELDLADALAGDPEALADLLQGPLVAVDEPEPQLQHPQSEEDRQRLWSIVRSLGQAVKLASPAFLLEDVSVPPGRVPDMLRRLEVLSHEAGVRIATSGHAGDGCLHPWVLLGDQGVQNDARATRLRTQIVREAHELGGSISGEYGIGILKRDLSTLEHNLTEMDVMSQLKQLLDPVGILNPGKVLPESRVITP